MLQQYIYISDLLLVYMLHVTLYFYINLAVEFPVLITTNL